MKKQVLKIVIKLSQWRRREARNEATHETKSWVNQWIKDTEWITHKTSDACYEAMSEPMSHTRNEATHKVN